MTSAEDIVRQIYGFIEGHSRELIIESFGYFLEDYVIKGADVTLDSRVPRRFVISEAIISFGDGLYRVFSDTVTLRDGGTYFVDFTAKNGFVVNKVHPTDPYLPLWQINADQYGNITSVVDLRGEMGYVRFKSEIQGIITDQVIVDEAHIKDGSVTGRKIANAAVQNKHLAPEVANRLDDAEVQLEEQNERINNIVADAGNSNTEIVDARKPAIGPAFPVLRDRLNAVDERLDDIAINVRLYGAKGGSADDSAAFENAINAALSAGKTTIFIPFSSVTLGTPVDCKGLFVIGSQTVLNGSLRNASGFRDVIIRGFDYSDIQFSPLIAPSYGTTKILYRLGPDSYYVLARKGSEGYLLYEMARGVVANANETNVGKPGDLLRVKGVLNLLDVAVYKNTYSAISGEFETIPSALIPGLSGRGVQFWRNASRSASDYIEYQVKVPDTGKFTVCFLAAVGSSNAATVSIDGVEVETLNLNMSSRLFIKEYSAVPGDRTIRITCGEDSRYIYVGGVNFYHLKDAPIGLEYDEYAYSRNDDSYITSTGALDYAILDSDTGKWSGSYHGGETLISEKIKVDNVDVSLSEDQLVVGRNIRIEQVTNIVDKLTSYTTHRFLGDGVFEFDCYMEGEINCQFFYTAMTTTSPTFTEIVYPIRHEIAPTDTSDIRLGRVNRIVQRNPLTGQQITTLFTLFNMDNNGYGGAIVRPEPDRYNKVYYGKVVSSLGKVRRIAFQTVRLFE